MKDNSNFPLRVKRGGCDVTIYAPSEALKYYRISYRVGGKRRQRTFKTLEEAQRETDALLDKLGTGENSVADLSTLDVAMLHTAKRELEEINVRLDRACYEYVQNIKRLGNSSLEEAVSFYIEHNPGRLKDIYVGELAGEFLQAKKEAGVSLYYLRDLRNRIGTFARDLNCRAGELAAEKVAHHFHQLGFKPENHNNQYRVLRTFFRYGQAQGYISESIDLLKAVARKKLRRGNYCIYQPAEFLALLEEADADMLAPLVLLGFCGIRPSEMRRLKWEDIRFNTRTLVLDALSTKTASRRTVPICEAALMWLLPYKGREGRIWARTDDYWSRSLHRLHRQVKVKQQPNALRHSYISYRLTLTGDVNRTALEAGNSPAMIHSHYHALVEDPAMASEWFDVGLEGSENMLRRATG